MLQSRFGAVLGFLGRSTHLCALVASVSATGLQLAELGAASEELAALQLALALAEKADAAATPDEMTALPLPEATPGEPGAGGKVATALRSLAGHHIT